MYAQKIVELRQGIFNELTYCHLHQDKLEYRQVYYFKKITGAIKFVTILTIMFVFSIV